MARADRTELPPNDHLTALDAGFWQLEDEQVALHIGAVGVFAGPTADLEAIRRRYAHLSETMPRLHQRMQAIPLDLERPVWVADPKLDLTYHVRCTALPAPGGEHELTSLVGRIMSARLDPTRPLWEAWVVEGLADDNWAIVWKTHHSVVDGLGGMELLSGLLDPPPGRRPRPPRWPRSSDVPFVEPRVLRVGRFVVDMMTDTVRTGGRAVRGAVSAARSPRTVIRELATGARGGRGFLGAVTHPATASSLTGPLGSARRYRIATVELADVKKVRSALGGSVNDVVLTMATRGFRELLLSRDETPGPQTVRTLVPVSVRSPLDHSALANKVSALLLDLPVDYSDAAAAYGAVRARMNALKTSGEAAAGVLITSIGDWLPAPAVNAAVRAARHLPQHWLTTVVTNVPGPRTVMKLFGQDMLALYPYVPIGDKIRITLAVTSYNGRLHFGITSDRDSVPDVDVLTAGLSAALDELVQYADRTQGVQA